jgi:RNA polymerase sigma-70 factor, ECF subfamily
MRCPMDRNRVFIRLLNKKFIEMMRIESMAGYSVTLQSTPDQERVELFESLVFTNTVSMLRTATRMCRSATEADDIVQETLLRAWKYWDSFEPGTNCRAWLFRIMINVIRRRKDNLESAAEHVSVDEPEMGNVLRFESKVEFDENGVLVALEKLPSEYRDVILLVLIEEFSYKESAVMLNIPMGTVMSRLYRARQMMKKLLKPSMCERATAK